MPADPAPQPVRAARSWAVLKPGEQTVNAGRATFFDAPQAWAWCSDDLRWKGPPRVIVGRIPYPTREECAVAGYRVIEVEIRAVEPAHSDEGEA